MRLLFFIVSAFFLNGFIEIVNAQIISLEKQLSLLPKEANKANNNSRSIYTNGQILWIETKFDWTEGFFLGIFQY